VSCSAELSCRDTNCTSYPSRTAPHYDDQMFSLHFAKCNRALEPNNHSRRSSPSNTTLDMLDMPAPVLLSAKIATSDPVSTTNMSLTIASLAETTLHHPWPIAYGHVCAGQPQPGLLINSNCPWHKLPFRRLTLATPPSMHMHWCPPPGTCDPVSSHPQVIHHKLPHDMPCSCHSPFKPHAGASMLMLDSLHVCCHQTMPYMKCYSVMQSLSVCTCFFSCLQSH
jgi:hypothetical protein